MGGGEEGGQTIIFSAVVKMKNPALKNLFSVKILSASFNFTRKLKYHFWLMNPNKIDFWPVIKKESLETKKHIERYSKKESKD